MVRERIQKLWRVVWHGFWAACYRVVERRAHHNSVVIRIEGAYPEVVPFSVWRYFRRDRRDFARLVESLRLVAADPKIETLVIVVSHGRMGLARTQETARLVRAARAAGKKTIAVIESGHTPDYAIAAQCERVVIVPGALLFVTGLAFESLFVKDLLDHLDVEPDLLHEGRYKSAAETLMRSGPSRDADRMMKELLADVHRELIDLIAAGRGVDAARVCEWLDGGPYGSSDAKSGGLVDDVAYWDEVRSGLGFDNGKRRFIASHRHHRIHAAVERHEALAKSAPVVAVVTAAGPIVDRSGRQSGAQITPKALGRVLRALRRDDDVKAVVLRVASPGGSGSASDLIHRELMRLKKKKPLVVSMGDVAASGGYYLAMAGDVVFTESASLTGSIGVISGKVSLRGLYDRIGVKKTVYRGGENAAIMSDYGTFSDGERKRMKALNREFYDLFKSRVASSRQMSVEEVEERAQGRVWSGAAAVERHLADRIGGLNEAINEAILRAKAGPLALVEHVHYVREPWMSFGSLPIAREMSSAVAALGDLVGEWSALYEELSLVRPEPTCLAVSRPRPVDSDEW
ncbi:MAG: signal peptide peptidase SppA [Deltaproteobacteria bacterium]|nr:signal peptide peptidase SppA [Deltaproteobacteria bacterium]